MRLTRFIRLQHAVTSLDINFFTKKIAELDQLFGAEGKPWELDNVAITEEGIFYINPESGVATKVVLYKADHILTRKDVAAIEEDPEIVKRWELPENLNPYHLLRCNALTQAKNVSDTAGYRIAQRLDAKFVYRFLADPKKPGAPRDLYEEATQQSLMICQNCFFKVASLLEGVRGLSRETFGLEYFFNVDFFRSWSRYGGISQEGSSIAEMYPKDWQEIIRIRKEQVQFHCEACGDDFSAGSRRNLLRVHPVDHTKRKVRYVRLQCLCAECYDTLTIGQKPNSPAGSTWR